MINFNKKDSVADSIKSILEKKELSSKQKKIANMAPPKDEIDAKDLAKLRAGHKPKKESEMHEEIDPKDRTKDMIRGRQKSNQTDDVGPGSDGKSTKVKYRGGPMATTSEEVEQIDELKKSTLASYAKKATDDVSYHSFSAGTRSPSDPERLKDDKKAMNRQAGVNKAIDRLAKEETKKTLRVFKEQYQENSIFDQMINEVLSKDASAGDWIHDFVHSDNPKFKGKSKEMRKKMALAAYYAKQRNEEVEQIDELSKDTLSAYKTAAHKSISKNAVARHAGEISSKEYHATASKRSKGIHRADADKRLATYADKKPKKLDISASGSNIQKQYHSGSPGSRMSEEIVNIEEGLKVGDIVKPKIGPHAGVDHEVIHVHDNGSVNIKPHRFTGKIQYKLGAVQAKPDQLHRVNEEVEHVEEGWDDMMKSVKDRSKPQPSGGSGVKKGSRYGGGKQTSKPEQDDESEKKK